jgi:hypothetical protein
MQLMNYHKYLEYNWCLGLAKKIYLRFLSIFFFGLNKLTNQYHTFHIRPKYNCKFHSLNSFFKFRIAIVIQGPIENFDFTLETIKFYSKNFKNVKIIISTWKGLSKRKINLIKRLNAHFVENTIPSKDSKKNWVGGNLNNQIITTREGIKLAKNIKCDYVLKTRADQRIYNNNIFHHLINLLEYFPVKKKYLNTLNQRIISINFDALLLRHYGISDILQFGKTTDMFNFWNVDFFLKSQLHSLSLKNKSIFLNSYLVVKFLKKNNIQIKWSILDTFKILSELFCIVDKEFFDLFWDKYDAREYRWKSYRNPRQTMEINFYTWLTLHTNYKIFYKCNKLNINNILKNNLKKDIWSQ